MTEKPPRVCISLLAILSLSGIALSVYSVYEHISFAVGLEAGSPLCTISDTFNCQKVLASSYSTIFKVPLGCYGLLFYLTVFGMTVLLQEHHSVNTRTLYNVIVTCSLGAAGFSVYLLYVSKFIIGAICPICFGTYIVNFGLLAVSWVAQREKSIFSRVADGFVAIARLPRLILSGSREAGPASALARIGLLGFLVAAFSALALPEYLLSKFAFERLARQEALGEWMHEEITNIPVDTVGGAFGDYSKGPTDAPIKIVEFSDYECPACRATHQILETVLADYKGKVHFTMKNFPLDNACNPYIPQVFHLQACFAANLARCAGEQGKFWEINDFLFETELLESRQNIEANRTEIISRVGTLGLDTEALKECMASSRQLDRIKVDIDKGQELGIEGTPSIWINGRKFVALGEPGFRAVFDTVLATK